MGEGAWLVTFLIVQRLVELGIAQMNTKRLRRCRCHRSWRGPLSAYDYPACVLVSRPLDVWPQSHRHSVLVDLLCPVAGWTDMGDQQPWPALDYSGDRAARALAERGRAIPLV
jgi:hypothetical protein